MPHAIAKITMSTVVTIPLGKNTEIAELVADKEPGDKLYGCFSIKAKDDQSLMIRIEEITDNIEDLPKPGEYDDDDESEKDEAKEGSSNGSTAGETEEADELAAPGGYIGP